MATEDARGRVVFEVQAERFVIYADRQLHRLPFLRAIADVFGIGRAKRIVRSDDHYRLARSVGLPGDLTPSRSGPRQ